MGRPVWCVVAAAILPFVPPALMLAAPTLASHLSGALPLLVFFSGVIAGLAALVYGFGVGGLLIAVGYVPAMCVTLIILVFSFGKWTDWP
jgi:hypothetical protein